MLFVTVINIHVNVSIEKVVIQFTRIASQITSCLFGNLAFWAYNLVGFVTKSALSDN